MIGNNSQNGENINAKIAAGTYTSASNSRMPTNTLPEASVALANLKCHRNSKGQHMAKHTQANAKLSKPKTGMMTYFILSRVGRCGLAGRGIVIV